ncbi:MAG: MBL fold metallo-hydrolase [Myxococcota bacterium]
MPRVFHLDCGPMRPWPAPLVDGHGRWRDAGHLVCHCLLIEGARELVLVDAGIGLQDIAHPERLGRGFRSFARPTMDPAMTAIEQIKRLGYSPSDVGHIVLTHLDLDHAGGLADFPKAKVHIYDLELDAALNPQGMFEKHRYRPAQFEHGVDWVRHTIHGERWEGFDGVRLAIDREEILLVPLHGHSRGHAGVAVEDGEGWMLHCGDAYFNQHEIRSRKRMGGPLGLALFRNLLAADNRVRRSNVARLRVLAEAAPDVRIFSAHDPAELPARE